MHPLITALLSCKGICSLPIWEGQSMLAALLQLEHGFQLFGPGHALKSLVAAGTGEPSENICANPICR